MRHNTAIIIFSKAPIKGQVKTRLIPDLGEQKALEIYMALLSHTVKTIVASALGDVYIDCTPTMNHPVFQRFQTQYKLSLRLQHGDDLGQRMFNAISQALLSYEQCILVGSDCPQIDKDTLQTTIEKLQTNELVLGPTDDGGYYLIAARKIDKRLFDDIEWGSDTVLSTTRQRVQQLRFKHTELTTKTDIDNLDDLQRMQSLPWLSKLKPWA